jgi:hypothetical protein
MYKCDAANMSKFVTLIIFYNIIMIQYEIISMWKIFFTARVDLIAVVSRTSHHLDRLVILKQ